MSGFVPCRLLNLDCALSTGAYQDAKALLRKMMSGNSLESNATLWDTAMKEKQHDVLRAMLILRPGALRELARNKQCVGQWLDELGRQDPGLSAALKEFPYHSTKRGASANFNGTAEWSVCRHLAASQQEVQALEPKIKFDYGKFSNAETIANNVPPENQQTYEALMAQASVTHLIDNSKFGQFLAGQFQEMKGEGKLATRLMLVESTNHAMNLGLMIKEKEGKKSCVVKFSIPMTS